jgi:hypothetical protein
VDASDESESIKPSSERVEEREGRSVKVRLGVGIDEGVTVTSMVGTTGRIW